MPPMGRERHIRPGDVAIIDYSREIVSVSTDFAIMYLMVARDRVPPLFLASSVHGTVFPAASGPARLLYRAMETLLQAADALTLAEADAAVDALLTMAEADAAVDARPRWPPACSKARWRASWDAPLRRTSCSRRRSTSSITISPAPTFCWPCSKRACRSRAPASIACSSRSAGWATPFCSGASTDR